MNAPIDISSLSAAGLFAPASTPAPLTLLFFELMADAEARYGPRDASWLFGGINYRATGGPATLPSINGPRRVVICLTQDALNDVALQRWQLAHEVVHLLSPPNMETATVFEEGLASYNQFVHSYDEFTGANLFSRSPLDYQAAFEAVRPLVERHPLGVSSLRAELGGALYPLSPSSVAKHFPSFDSKIAKYLCEMFYS